MQCQNEKESQIYKYGLHNFMWLIPLLAVMTRENFE